MRKKIKNRKNKKDCAAWEGVWDSQLGSSVCEKNSLSSE